MGIFGKKKEEQPVGKETSKKEVKTPVAKTSVKKEAVQKVKGPKAPVVSKDILIKPLITEKVTDMKDKNQYVFAVNTKANKIEVAKEIKKTYNVEPIKVNMQYIRGKKVRFGRNIGKQKDWKKAIVILKKGDKISVGTDAK